MALVRSRTSRLALPASGLLGLALACAPSGPSERVEPAYVGRATCAPCHEREVRAWSGSHHDLAMQPADAATVLGDFADAEVVHLGVATRFFRRDGRYRIRTAGPDGAPREYAVTHTFGVEPLQQYLVEHAGGRLQAFPIAWDARPAREGGQHWFVLEPEVPLAGAGVRHWTGPSFNWNHACAECHSTNLRKGYDASEERFATAWSEIDVSCEACHGPGSEHVRWAERKEGGARASGMGLVASLRDPSPASWVFAPAARTAHREPPVGGQTEIETCARCHSRRAALTDDYRHGRPLADTHRVALLEEGLYHADGQIDDEVYVYGSFRQSRMYERGVTCSDCHDPHTTRLRVEGNATCAACHRPDVYDSPGHHFHPAGSRGAQCVECHMPARTYMVLDPRRDHSLRVPRPDLTLAIGTPNACNGCHAERDAAWAARAVERWYGPERAPHYGEALHAGRTWRADAGERLRATVRDPLVPAIVRATAFPLLGRYIGPGAAPIVERGIGDPDPLVRAAAATALGPLDPADRLRLGAIALADPVRTVRLEGAAALADLPDAAFDAGQREALEAALREYEAAQRFDADRPAGRHGLGWLHARRGELDAAEREYRAALAIDPTFSPAAIDLAELHRLRGRDGEGEIVLRDALATVPDDPALHHALGLLLARRKEHAAAIEALSRATGLAPGEPHYAYVLGVALHSTGRTPEALRVLEGACARHPGHTELLLALATIHRDRGETAAAVDYARRLARATIGQPAAEALLAELGAGSQDPQRP